MKKNDEVEMEEEKKRHIPLKEYEGKTYQEDGFQNFRIVVKGKKSDWVDIYDCIASLEIDGELFIGVSAFWGNILPCRTALRIEKVDEDGESDFYKFKIIDLIAEETLGAAELEGILKDPLYNDDDYEFAVKGSKKKDYIKLRIMDFRKGRYLNGDGAEKYLRGALLPGEFDVFNEEGKKINVEEKTKGQTTLDNVVE